MGGERRDTDITQTEHKMEIEGEFVNFPEGRGSRMQEHANGQKDTNGETQGREIGRRSRKRKSE